MTAPTLRLTVRWGADVRSLDFRVEAAPDGAQEWGIDPVCGYDRLRYGVLATPLAARVQDREDFMREGRRTRLGAASAWAPALAARLTERSHRRSTYDESIDRILGRGHNPDDQ
jgi:hypothetical protein